MRALLESALCMASAGWGVIPLHTPVDGVCDCHRPDCSSPGKHPRTKNGLSDATTDVDRIRRWWGMWPAANIGAVVPDGFVVVDVDVADLATVFRSDELPGTATSRTGRGRHLVYFTADEAVEQTYRMAETRGRRWHASRVDLNHTHVPPIDGGRTVKRSAMTPAQRRLIDALIAAARA